MKVLVTGVKGQLGYDVVKVLKQRNIECLGVDIEDFDLTNEEQVQSYVKNYAPSAVIHCAAYTAVDQAEEDKEVCKKVNVDGTGYLAEACRDLHAKMLYISTDYVFPGEGTVFYEVQDETGPTGHYGLTKLMGEEAVKAALDEYFIVRISWVFGVNGGNFVKTMLRLGRERDELNVVCDQVGSPTYTADLARLLCDMIGTKQYGTYHATNEGVCSWADFAKEIFRLAGYDVKVNEITSEEYPSKAKRPKNSRMSKRALDEAGFHRLPDWKNALQRFLVSVGENSQ